MRSEMKIFNRCLKIVFSLAIMIVIIQFLSPISISTGAFEFETSIKVLGSGKTQVCFPPLGNITASTHSGPLNICLTLRNINLEELSEFASTISRADSWSDNIYGQLKTNVIKYFLLLSLLAFISGAVCCLLWPSYKNNKLEMLYSGLINFLVLSLLISVAVFSYNPKAFSHAEYEGILEAAPWVFSVLEEEGIGIIEEIGLQFTDIVENISFMQKKMKTSAAVEKNSGIINILHISDIHNNPAAFDFIRRITDIYNIDLIIDTGDRVDYGTVLEMEFLAHSMDGIDVPCVFIPGNHDSPLVIEKLKMSENVSVLEEGIMETAGLRIAGLADSSSRVAAMTVESEDMIEDNARKLAETVSFADRVDLIAVHNPAYLKYVRNNDHLLLSGHLHTPYVKDEGNYIEINAGTTGASGIRGIQNMDINFSLVLLRMQYSEKKDAYSPLSADLIEVKQFPLNYSFEHFVFDDD
jgi:predicted phosphodiesterase